MIRHAADLNGLPSLIPDDPTHVIVQWLLNLVGNEREPTLGAENEMVKEVCQSACYDSSFPADFGLPDSALSGLGVWGGRLTRGSHRVA